MKKINFKKLNKNAKRIIKSCGLNIGSHTWYFTVLFFLTAFGVSIWVWWNCFQHPVPSSEVVLRVEQGKENYTEMKARTEEVINTLQESRNNFENPPSFENQRELFLDVDSENPPKFIDESALYYEEEFDIEAETVSSVEKEDTIAGPEIEKDSEMNDLNAAESINSEIPIQ